MMLEHLLQAWAYLSYPELLETLLPSNGLLRLLVVAGVLVLVVGSAACP